MHGKAEAIGARAANGAMGNNASANLAVAFTKNTAAKTGQSERNVQRDVTRAKRLGDDLKRVASTSLDKGAELDALAQLKPEERAPLIERATAGEKVSAIRRPAPIRKSELTRAGQAFRVSWLKANADDRAAVLTENKRRFSELRTTMAYNLQKRSFRSSTVPTGKHG